MMEDMITTIFVLCDELLKALNIKEDPQVKMNNAEVMTVGLVAAYFFGGQGMTMNRNATAPLASSCSVNLCRENVLSKLMNTVL